jgi:TatD DNase family protein
MNIFKLDTHMHFDLYKERNEVLDYIESEKSYSIAVTNLPDLYEKYLRSFNTVRRKYVRLALGFHPELAFQFQHQIRKFDDCLSSTKYIGEIGLDFTSKEESYRAAQEKIFKHIIRACNKTGGKILSIHSRRAEKEVFNSLRELTSCSIIMHWYSGPIDLIDEGLQRGYYFSINHQMILSLNGRRIVDYIPINRILFESDAPFTKELAQQYRTSFMEDLYKYLCNSRRFTQEELSLQIRDNFKTLIKQKNN